jgi:hypothetical protein
MHASDNEREARMSIVVSSRCDNDGYSWYIVQISFGS